MDALPRCVHVRRGGTCYSRSRIVSPLGRGSWICFIPPFRGSQGHLALPPSTYLVHYGHLPPLVGVSLGFLGQPCQRSQVDLPCSRTSPFFCFNIVFVLLARERFCFSIVELGNTEFSRSTISKHLTRSLWPLRSTLHPASQILVPVLEPKP